MKTVNRAFGKDLGYIHSLIYDGTQYMNTDFVGAEELITIPLKDLIGQQKGSPFTR